MIVGWCLVAGLAVGLVSSLAVAGAADQPFTVEVLPPDEIGQMFGDTWHVFLSGTLPADAAGVVVAACRENGMPARHAKVSFDCPGGDVAGAMELGRLIREERWSTEVGRRAVPVYMSDSGACQGAAVLAYLGGWFRFLHVGDVLAYPSRLDTPEVRRYLDELGYGPTLLERAARAGDDALLQLTRDGWASLGVVNKGAQPVVWRLTPHERGTVLVGEQETWRGFGRVVISCVEENVLVKFVFAAGRDPDAVIAGTTAHELSLDDARSPFEVMLPPWHEEGFVNILGILDPDQVRGLRRAEDIGYAGVRIAPGIELAFTIPVGPYREFVDRFLAACGDGTDHWKDR